LDIRCEYCNAPIEEFFVYICERNEGKYLHPLRDTLRLRFNLRNSLRRARGVRNILGSFRRYSRHLRHRLLGHRALVKDPFTLFSSPWLASRFGMKVVNVIRHPAAFVASVKRAGWRLSPKVLLKQNLLVQDVLGPWQAEMEKACRDQWDAIRMACLHWRIIAGVTHSYQQAHPDWVLVRHEDASADPQAYFQALYGQLDLSYTSRARRTIQAASTVPDWDGDATRMYNTQRDSRKNLGRWKHELTNDDIRVIRSATEDCCPLYYSDVDW